MWKILELFYLLTGHDNHKGIWHFQSVLILLFTKSDVHIVTSVLICVLRKLLSDFVLLPGTMVKSHSPVAPHPVIGDAYDNRGALGACQVKILKC